MPNEEHYRKLIAMYLSAPLNDYYHPRMEIAEGRCDLILPVQPSFFHAAGALHGSVYFKACDDAAFFAANSLVPDVFVLTANFTLYLLRPINKGEIVTSGKVVNATANVLIAESVALDADGKEIARGSGTFMRSKIPLDETVGYR